MSGAEIKGIVEAVFTGIAGLMFLWFIFKS